MQFTPINYTCSGCGAPLKYSPLTGTLRCEFCQRETPIEGAGAPIIEHDLRSALAALDHAPNQEITKEITCPKCGGSFTLDPYAVSTHCPYCDTPAITEFVNDIQPESILPFRIGHQEAQSIFARWIGSLWFAPTAFTKYFNSDKKLKGYYLPYWTYDSNTISHYQGLRGDTYYVTVTRTMIRNGREEQVQVQEARVRWRPASGSVSLSFDDISIGASKTISRAIIDSVGPWNTESLKPFDEEDLSGFEAEEYTIGLDNGFEYAKAKMSQVIEQAIRRDIGGDQQQIHSVDSNYLNVTYKSVLFPLWTANFKWKEKIYRYAINAQTGKISGERPYSIVKIVFAAMLIAAIVAAALYYDQMKG